MRTRCRQPKKAEKVRHEHRPTKSHIYSFSINSVQLPMGCCLKFYLTHDIHFSPSAVAHFLCILFGVPVFDEMPLTFVYNTHMHTDIQYTNQIERPNV